MARIRQLHQQLRKKAILRADLRTAFVTDPNEGTLRDLLKREEFRSVSYARAKAWATQEDWEQLRADYIEKWQKDVVKRMGSIQTRRHLEQLKRIQDLRERAFDAIAGADAPPAKSLEGLLAVMLKLEEAEKNLGDEIENRLAGVATGTSKAQLPGALADDTSFDEAQKLLATKFNLTITENDDGLKQETIQPHNLIPATSLESEQDGGAHVGNTTTVIYNANPASDQSNSGGADGAV